MAIVLFNRKNHCTTVLRHQRVLKQPDNVSVLLACSWTGKGMASSTYLEIA
jgi:hypothetical protein